MNCNAVPRGLCSRGYRRILTAGYPQNSPAQLAFDRDHKMSLRRGCDQHEQQEDLLGIGRTSTDGRAADALEIIVAFHKQNGNPAPATDQQIWKYLTLVVRYELLLRNVPRS